tara:strand:+ start:350 stop:928 length:579 start_codon:yes stop_codon:yes gene_type:complete
MIIKFYSYILIKSKSRFAIPFLSLISFLESIIFPIPTDIFIVPIVLSNKKKFLFIAFIATFFSVLGGAVGYLIGQILWNEIGYELIKFYGLSEKAQKFEIIYEKYGIIAVIIGSITPFPYKVIALISGMLSLPLGYFLIFSFIFRGLRFFIIALLIFHYGEKFDRMFKRYTLLFSLGFIFILIMGFLLLKII